MLNLLNPAKAFLNNKSALVTLTVIAMGAWLYSRVSQINPAILQDEWIYVITSKVDSPWANPATYDLSNYLFNFIYSSTNLCGEAFYSCGKVLNLIFFTGFVLALFSIALRFLPFWAAYTVLIALYLSPISIYVSMYLPESLYYALLALAFWLIVRVIERGERKEWTYVGAALGLAALAKPHALFTVAAFGIFLLIWEFSKRGGLKTISKSVLYFGLSFLVVRLGLGLVVAGPKALNLIGSYGAADAVGEFVTGAGSAGAGDASSLVGAGPVAGALGLFIPQLSTHFLVLSALVGGLLSLLILALIESIRRKSQSTQSSLAVLLLVWIGVLLIVVALFTGWITGGGDDHTTRILVRYYEFLIPIVAIPALGYLFDKAEYLEAKAWARITAMGLGFAASSAAFTGFFTALTVQIADAPGVAGLIGDGEIWNLVGVVTAISIVALAFFPKVGIYVMLAAFSVSMVGTGYVTQNQYLQARGDASEADIAGKFATNYVPQDEIAGLTVITNSRFEGRVASFWMESDNPLLILERGAIAVPADLLPETKWVLALGLTSLDNFAGNKIVGPGYILYEITNEFDFSLTGSSGGTALESVEGFGVEMGGLLWTEGNEAGILLNRDLPVNAVLRLEVSAMPGILDQEVQVTIGDSTVILSIKDVYKIAELELTFNNTEPADEIKITIPEVQSNAALGGVTERLIGLGIGEISLVLKE
jgi:hypothetical protein